MWCSKIVLADRVSHSDGYITGIVYLQMFLPCDSLVDQLASVKIPELLTIGFDFDEKTILFGYHS